MINRLQRWFGNGWFGIAELLMTVFCVFFSLSVHEFAHGYAAYKLGDSTAKNMGRLNINPTSHLDPIGAICLFLFGFGWAKPVPINVSNFRRDRMKSGMVVTAIAGPCGNLVIAFLSLLLIFVLSAFVRVSGEGISGTIYSVIVLLLSTLVTMNISLAVFNLIPVPPLDGSKILNAVLPSRIYFKIMEYERYGFLILLILINTPFFSRILFWLVNAIYSLFIFIIELIPFL